MKHLLSLVLLFGSLNVFAQDDRSAKGGQHNVSAIGSFNSGGFSFGGSYEFMAQDSLGMGGHLRMFQKEDTGPNQTHGYTILGFFVSHHFYKRSWDLSFSPSFNFINIDAFTRNPDDTTTFGPGLSIALLIQLTDNVAAGFDWSNYYVWFDEDYAGMVKTDLGAKIRFSF